MNPTPATTTELTLVTLSALEHYAYCPRQAGLILLEDGYADDAATVRGTLLHLGAVLSEARRRDVAVVLWGDRGSQPQPGRVHRLRGAVAVVLWGGRGSQHRTPARAAP